MNNIKVLKLLSGEEIICKISQEDPDEQIMYVKDIRLLATHPTPNGMQVGFQPWLVTIDPGSEVPIRVDYIMMINPNIPKDLEEAYIKAVSNIQIVSA